MHAKYFKYLLHPLLLLTTLNEIFVQKSQAAEYKSCGVNNTEQCVPYMLCNEGLSIGSQYYVDHTRSILDDDCHYMEKCCEIEETLPQAPSLNTSEENYRTCGQRMDDWFYLRPLGYKRNEAKFAEFPWIVAILAKNETEYLCSGALVTPQVVITAAHCVEPFKANVTTEIVVRAGEWDASVELEPLPHENRRVKELIIHANYTKVPVMHNLALLLLEMPFALAPHIQTLCLPAPSMNFNYTQCFVSGWHKLEFGNHKEIMLKKVPMFALPSDQCASKIRLAILGRRYTLHDSLICTGGDINDYVCHNSGGVPLVCAMNGCESYYLAGLLARGARCDGTQLLGIYTNIKYYRAWIDLKLRERDVDIRYYMK